MRRDKNNKKENISIAYDEEDDPVNNINTSETSPAHFSFQKGIIQCETEKLRLTI